MNNDNESSLLFQHLFFPPLDENNPELSRSVYTSVNRGCDSDNVADPVGNLFKAAADAQLTKGSGPVEPIGAAPRVQLSKAFLERSQGRLERFAMKANSLFPGHPEEIQQMTEILESVFEAERSAMIRDAA